MQNWNFRTSCELRKILLDMHIKVWRWVLTKSLHATLPTLLKKSLASRVAQLTKERTKTSARLDGLYGLDELHKPQLFNQDLLTKFNQELFNNCFNLNSFNHAKNR